MPVLNARTSKKYTCPAVNDADTLNCKFPAPSSLLANTVDPFDPYNVPYESDNAEDAGFDAVNTQVPDTDGTIRNQSLSPAVSIDPLTDEPRFDHEQYDDTDDPQSSTITTPGWDTVIVRVTTGLPAVVVTVTVAERADVVVFACADKAKDPSPVPDDGLSVNQDALEDADHEVFDDTDTDDEPADADATAHDDAPKSNDAAGAVAATV